ncbi:hypothetical protein Rhsp01_38980 [Rhizobium sp. NBRC 114257]|uniref:Uncharacterized protein n=1 Tax=Rhizobium dioscoreae TaxID=2653122 RepID=A0ABQ0Z6Y0_9HYPH|nr:hypothetical protein RsS93_38840 [Rhizobium dioscoreae]GLU82722.1 hypothetical protein Rhsp01_38980 [Rhizobium sp. NBRC 114257]
MDECLEHTCVDASIAEVAIMSVEIRDGKLITSIFPPQSGIASIADDRSHVPG